MILTEVGGGYVNLFKVFNMLTSTFSYTIQSFTRYHNTDKHQFLQGFAFHCTLFLSECLVFAGLEREGEGEGGRIGAGEWVGESMCACEVSIHTNQSSQQNIQDILSSSLYIWWLISNKTYSLDNACARNSVSWQAKTMQLKLNF